MMMMMMMMALQKRGPAPQKGVDEDQFAVDCLVGDIVWIGYSNVLLKSDNEPAILKLLQASLKELRSNGVDQVMSENSLEYDPQANGSAEVGVRLLKGQLRTLRSSLEAQIGFRVPVRHAVTSWLVRHSAALIRGAREATTGRRHINEFAAGNSGRSS